MWWCAPSLRQESKQFDGRSNDSSTVFVSSKIERMDWLSLWLWLDDLAIEWPTTLFHESTIWKQGLINSVSATVRGTPIRCGHSLQLIKNQQLPIMLRSEELWCEGTRPTLHDLQAGQEHEDKLKANAMPKETHPDR